MGVDGSALARELEETRRAHEALQEETHRVQEEYLKNDRVGS